MAAPPKRPENKDMTTKCQKTLTEIIPLANEAEDDLRADTVELINVKLDKIRNGKKDSKEKP